MKGGSSSGAAGLAASRCERSSVAQIRGALKYQDTRLGIAQTLPQGSQSRTNLAPYDWRVSIDFEDPDLRLRPGERVALPQQAKPPLWSAIEGIDGPDIRSARTTAPLLGPDLWRYNHFPLHEFDRLKVHIWDANGYHHVEKPL